MSSRKSAMGARADGVSDYHRTKYRAEEFVRGHAPAWTIIRPSMIHGPDGEFMQMVRGWARHRRAPFLFMPYFAGGFWGTQRPGRLQPVYVEDVARAFVDALGNTSTIGQTYELGGAETFTWPEFHRTAARILTGKKRLTLALPAWKAKLLARIIPGSLLPFNRDQVIMALEDNIGDNGPFIRDFGWQPQQF